MLILFSLHSIDRLTRGLSTHILSMCVRCSSGENPSTILAKYYVAISLQVSDKSTGA